MPQRRGARRRADAPWFRVVHHGTPRTGFPSQIADGISHRVESPPRGEDLQGAGGRSECSAMEAARILDRPPTGENIRLARRLAGCMGQRELARLLDIAQSRLSD